MKCSFTLVYFQRRLDLREICCEYGKLIVGSYQRMRICRDIHLTAGHIEVRISRPLHTELNSHEFSGG